MGLPRYQPETILVRRIARLERVRWIWTKHALAEALDAKLRAPDVEYGLQNGTVTLHETKKDVLYRTECIDIDGRRFTAIIAVYEQVSAIKIVTVF